MKESERQKATSDFEEWKSKELAAEKQLQMEEEETLKSSPRIMSGTRNSSKSKVLKCDW